MTENIDTKNRSKSEIEPYLKDIFETYCLWKSLPSIFKFPPKDKKTGTAPSSREFCEMLGIGDEKILELADIRYQRDFANKFGVNEDTLSIWNKTVALRDSMEDIRKWARGLTKNVIASLYNTAVRKGSSFEVKLYMQLVEGWEEKQKVEHDYKGVTSFTVIRPSKIIDVTPEQNDGDSSAMGIDREASTSVGHTAQ